MNRIFQIYIVPAAVFISVIMGGGYGTGREVVEFFTRYGLLGGMLGICVASCVFSFVLVCTYEFARVFKVYDYKSFFAELIGPFWVLFEFLSWELSVLQREIFCLKSSQSQVYSAWQEYCFWLSCWSTWDEMLLKRF